MLFQLFNLDVLVFYSSIVNVFSWFVLFSIIISFGLITIHFASKIGDLGRSIGKAGSAAAIYKGVDYAIDYAVDKIKGSNNGDGSGSSSDGNDSNSKDKDSKSSDKDSKSSGNDSNSQGSSSNTGTVSNS